MQAESDFRPKLKTYQNTGYAMSRPFHDINRQSRNHT